MTLETILRTVLHAVAWSALVAFCGVVASVGVRWMLSKLGHAVAETGRRCGKWAAVMLEAGVAATSSNSLLVTWVNGLLDRNPLTPTNF